ncbi:hypothetical protein [Pricia antarctica]|uniref:hypothetical protein n=1 Tax=Pricia antarctica TaxID=641691 RepID=UPI0015878368|nr:hypothetical protein [Pricia antarctica]
MNKLIYGYTKPTIDGKLLRYQYLDLLFWPSEGQSAHGRGGNCNIFFNSFSGYRLQDR